MLFRRPFGTLDRSVFSALALLVASTASASALAAPDEHVEVKASVKVAVKKPVIKAKPKVPPEASHVQAHAVALPAHPAKELHAKVVTAKPADKPVVHAKAEVKVAKADAKPIHVVAKPEHVAVKVPAMVALRPETARAAIKIAPQKVIIKDASPKVAAAHVAAKPERVAPAVKPAAVVAALEAEPIKTEHVAAKPVHKVEAHALSVAPKHAGALAGRANEHLGEPKVTPIKPIKPVVRADAPVEVAERSLPMGRNPSGKFDVVKIKGPKGSVAVGGAEITRPTTTAARSPSSTNGQTRKGKVALKPCYGSRVHVDRGGLESDSFALADCNGAPLASARERLSVLVRPWGAAKPKLVSHGGVLPHADAKGEVAPGVRLLDPGLVTRLDAIAKHFRGKGFSFVSGYRPQSRGSLHQSGRAVDVRVTGVSNEQLVAFCKTLKDTGCGYYPNSSFVHVDVRNPKTGSVTWIDASGPGEKPHYVGQWPPPKAPAGTLRDDAASAPPMEEEPHDDVKPDELPVKKPLGEYPDQL